MARKIRKRSWDVNGVRRGKRNGVCFQADVYHRGMRFRMSCDSAADAKDIEAEVRLAMRRGVFSPEFYKKTLADVVHLMLTDMERDYKDEVIPYATFKNVQSTCLNYLLADRTRHDVEGRRHYHDKMMKWNPKQAIGHLKLVDIPPHRVTEFRTALRRAGANYELRSRTLSALRRAFNFAIHDLGWAHTNPCDGMEEKKFKADMRGGVEVPEQNTIDLLMTVASPWQSLILTFTCSTALRVGELMALTWGDFKVKMKRIEVRYTIDKSGRRVRPKSESGMRPVDLSDELVNALVEHREATVERNDGEEPADDDFIFTARSGRHFTHSTLYDQVVHPLFDAALVYQQSHPDEFEPLPANIKWKDFRHFAISCWLTVGFPDVVVWTMAGHSSFHTIERVYGHMFQSEERSKILSDLHKRVFTPTPSYEAQDDQTRLEAAE